MKDLSARCKAVVEFVPFKKYADPAYGILSDMHRFWSESKAGPKIIEYRELRNLNRILSRKKL